MNENNFVLKSNRKKWVLLLAVVLMSFMSCLDASIVNVALPVMTKKLSVSMSQIEWVVTSYILTISITILFFGYLGDIAGKSRIFKAGMLLFTLSSLVCGLAVSYRMLIICRIIQGIGAAAYMANNQGIITEAFPKNERGKALGLLATGVAVGTMLGAPLGGLIISICHWSVIFFINVPIGIMAFLIGSRVIKEPKDTSGRKDKVRLLRPEIVTNTTFSLSLLCAFISYICISASTILIPFYLQDVQKITSVHTGIIMIAAPLIIAIVSPISGSLSDRLGAYKLSFLGLIIMSLGFFLMSFIKEASPLSMLLLFLIATAVGQAIFQPSNNSLIMSSVPSDCLGAAGSMNSLARNLGQSFGVILSNEILFVFMSNKFGSKIRDYIKGREDVFIYGMNKVYIVLFLLCLAGVLLAIYRHHSRKSVYQPVN